MSTPHEYPGSWQRGQLLDLKRYTDGTFRAFLLGDESEHPPSIAFGNAFETQGFISWWYQPEQRQ